MKKSEVSNTINECLLNFDSIFDKLEEIYKNNHPKKGEEHYEDPVFKRFHDELTEKYETILNSTILKTKNTPENLITELKTYFLDSFVNKFRLNYGTGHELNFCCCLLILYKSNMYTEKDFIS